tara:strand:+ start:194 stop:868 length:675 start_codon:yes stop_codon:yes gene_type:complete
MKIKLPVSKLIKTNGHIFFLLFFVALFHPVLNAQNNQSGFAFDSNVNVIHDDFGNCVRSGSPSQKEIKDKCGFNKFVSDEQTDLSKVDDELAVDSEIEDITPSNDSNDQTISTSEKISTEIKFNFDQHIITKSAKLQLDNFIQRAEKVAFRMINILGHADSLGGTNYNIQLSVKRAKSVENYLTNNGVTKNKITSTGLGESKPIADNGTREGRAQNRRVFIELE